MQRTRRWILPAVLIALLAACSSSSSSSQPSQNPTGAVAMITQNWEAFFSGKTSAGQKTKLLQNGQKFASLIQAQAGSGFAQSAEARVHGVIVRGSAATVTYDILIGGHPALTNQTGTAVLVNGTWEVGDQSFCALLALQGTPPPQCKAAGG